MKTWSPRDYQESLRIFAMHVHRSNWWAGTGTGKTAAGINLYDHLRLFGEANRMLVVSTKRVAKMVWTKEVLKWENFHHLSIAAAIGTADQRKAALMRNAQITTINFDNLPWLIDGYGEDSFPFDMVFCDESSKVKNLRIALQKHHISGKEFLRKSGGSERAQRLARVAHKRVRRWVNATGTPASNGLIDLYGQCWYLDAGSRLGRTFTSYKDRYFRQIRVDDYQTILEPFEHSDAEIKAKLADITITIEAKDYFDLPPTVYNKIPITLPPEAYKRYREMEKEMFTEIQAHEIEAFNAGSKSMKCRQLASGAAYVDDKGNWVEVHNEKLEALHDIIADINGEPIIVAYQFKSDLARLKKEFPKGVYFDDSQRTLDAFVAGKIPILFLHPASASHGVDEMQQACRHVCFFSMTWNLEEFQQVIERVGATRQVQAGFYRTVYVHLLICENTVEEDMIERIETKASVQESIKNAMKKRGLQ